MFKVRSCKYVYALCDMYVDINTVVSCALLSINEGIMQMTQEL